MFAVACVGFVYFEPKCISFVENQSEHILMLFC